MQLYIWYKFGKMCVFISLSAMSFHVIFGLSVASHCEIDNKPTNV